MANKTNRTESLPDHNGHVFKVGHGVHWGYNGDSYPGTVLYISDSGRKVFVSRDRHKVVDKLGGYVEGARECEFTTVDLPLEMCDVYSLSKKGYFMPHGGRGTAAWALKHGRVYSQNPSF